jgi:signal transduction histidine kinase
VHGASAVLAWLRGLPELVADGALALLLLGVEISVKHLEPGYQGWSSPPTVVALIIGSLTLTVRRRAPRVALGAAAIPAALAIGTGFPVGDIGLSVALYTLADRCPRRQSLMVLALLIAGKVVVGVVHPVTAVGIPVWVYFFVVARAFGCHQQTERALRHELEHRARQLEHERELRVRRAAADERARIARDLHDVVAHSVSVMVLHTAAARRTLSHDPHRAAQAFAQVETTGRQSLTELRQLLGLLRQDDQPSDLRPAPSLDYLDDLVDGFREVGLSVVVRVDGDPRPLPPVVDVCAYRIAQEALTNALKHAAASRVEVTVGYEQGELRLVVADDGRGAPIGLVAGDEGGHGLLGMSERAALVGGRLIAGQRPGGGFRIDAALPTEG